jgi:uncharacterized protein (UPF0332 family)
MNEIGSLIERSERYLRSAELLLEDGDYESSVSRSYYAMYFATQAVLLLKNLSHSSHRGTISAFGEHFIKTGVFPREMGRELNRSFAKRQMGDYEYTFVIEKDEAAHTLATGKEFVRILAEYLRQMNDL